MTSTNSIAPGRLAVTPSRRPIPYRRHNCARTHRSFRTTARCIWNRAYWVSGEGPYATVSRCRRGGQTVMLHRTQEAALEAFNIMEGGCGGQCIGRHDYVVLTVNR